MSYNGPKATGERVVEMEEETHDMIEGIENAESEFSEIMDEFEKAKSALNQAMHGLEEVEDIIDALDNASEMGADGHPDAGEFEQTLFKVMKNLYIAKSGLEQIKNQLNEEEKFTTSLEEADIKVEEGILKVAEAVEHEQMDINSAHTKDYIDNLRHVISEERKPPSFD